MNDRIHVAVGVIFNTEKNQVLLTKRTSKQHLAGLWEFPGGKLENNENVFSALYRELYEELGIKVIKAEAFSSIEHDYPEKKVLLDIWKIFEWQGNPESREGQEIIWCPLENLNSYRFPEANEYILNSLSLPPMYVISKETYQDVSDLYLSIENCFKAGVKIFQLRLNKAEGLETTKIVNNICQIAKNYKANVILNGSVKEFEKNGFSGLHLKANEMMEYQKRPISMQHILGVSCHNAEELAHAAKLNVNYAFLSPIKQTSSHPDKSPMGWSKFSKLCKKARFPVYALGGMTCDDLKKANSHGAHGVAMISGFWNAQGTKDFSNLTF